MKKIIVKRKKTSNKIPVKKLNSALQALQGKINKNGSIIYGVLSGTLSPIIWNVLAKVR